MLGRLGFLALALFGCAAPVQQAPAAAPRVAVATPVAACDRAPLPERAPTKNRCLPDGPAPIAKAKEQSNGSTCVDHTRMEARLAPLLKKRYERVAKGVLDVSFGCDPVTSELEEITVETGYGHGGSLSVWRLVRDDAGDFDVLGIAHDSHYFRPPPDAAGTVSVARGKLAARLLERALETARPALVATVRELEPPPVPNSIGLHSMFFSSGNFHHFVRLRDGVDHELSRAYTGYPGSDDQRRYIGLQLAVEKLDPLLDEIAFAREVPDEKLRAWFSAHAVEAFERTDPSDGWWVRERLVNLAGKAGDRRVVPLVVTQLERGLSEVQKAPDDRKADLAERYLVDPLAALAGVTGWDARKTPDGAELSLSAAARQAVSECRSATR